MPANDPDDTEAAYDFTAPRHLRELRASAYKEAKPTPP
jgi:hypothetical protein